MTTLPAPAAVARHHAVIAERIAKIEDPAKRGRAAELLAAIRAEVTAHTRPRAPALEAARGQER